MLSKGLKMATQPTDPCLRSYAIAMKKRIHEELDSPACFPHVLPELLAASILLIDASMSPEPAFQRLLCGLPCRNGS